MSAPSCMSRNTSGPPVSCGGGGIPSIPGRLHCPRGLVEVPHFSSTRRPPHFYSAVPTRRGRWSEAAAYYSTTVKQYPEVAPPHEQLAVTRLLAEDLPGYRAACTGMLERFQPIDDPTAAVRVASACSLAAEAVSDMQGLIQVSERASRSVGGNERPLPGRDHTDALPERASRSVGGN